MSCRYKNGDRCTLADKIDQRAFFCTPATEAACQKDWPSTRNQVVTDLAIGGVAMVDRDAAASLLTKFSRIRKSPVPPPKPKIDQPYHVPYCRLRGEVIGLADCACDGRPEVLECRSKKNEHGICTLHNVRLRRRELIPLAGGEPRRVGTARPWACTTCTARPQPKPVILPPPPAVSVLIPARGEQYLQQTIDDLLRNYCDAAGQVEIIVALDGGCQWPYTPIRDNWRVRLIHWSPARGMRAAINAAAGIAAGKWLMKCDAHCSFEDRWNAVLAESCGPRTLVIPRRYDLAPNRWAVTDKPPVDYHYLSCPWDERTPYLKGRVWGERAAERARMEIDEEMTTQGSCWFCRRDHFEAIGGLDEETFGQFGQEAQEIGNKTWLSGGQVLVNKRTWYAHWSKPSRPWGGADATRAVSRDYWLAGKWPGQTRPLAWLIEHFWPVPGWPADWRERMAEHVAT